MATVDSIKVLVYQKEYIKMSDKYVDTPASVFVAGSGDYSIVAANDTETEATDSYSYAEGSGTSASGLASHAEGCDTTAEGEYSHVEGYGTAAKGTSSHAEGFGTVSSGDYCHAEGWYTFATYGRSHAEGEETLAVGSGSHAEGTSTASCGDHSHAEGSGTKITLTLTGSDGAYSFTGVTATSLKKGMVILDPSLNQVGAILSINEVNNSITLDNTLGTLTQQMCDCYCHCASGTGSHVEGSDNIVIGSYAHAEGSMNVALGDNSHAEGYYTKANGQYQHVSGKYNAEDLNNTYAEIIGIGTADSARRNGRTLDWSGNE